MNTLIRSAAMPTLAGLFVCLAASAGLSAPPAAAESAEIGNRCAGNSAPVGKTAVMTAKGGADSLPITPGARGVITRATFNVPALKGATFQTTLKTMRGTGVANEITVVAQSAPLPIADGARTFDVRIPIAAGDLVGAWGLPGTLLCNTGDSADVVGVIDGDLQPGQTATFTPRAGQAIPVVATVEPDVDGDGYGDDTQDRCARSAALQTACPVIRLASTAAAQQGSILVVVSSDHPARVRVTGKTRVNGTSVKLDGGIRKVKPWTLGRFTVPYPKALKAALAALPPGGHITVKLTARTTDRLGRITTATSRVRVARS